MRFVSNTLRFLTILYADFRNTGCKVSQRCCSKLVSIPRYRCYRPCPSLNDIQNFMFTNKLKLNPDKTEFILIGSHKNRKQLLPHFPISILGNQVSPAQSVRNLGVVFDSNFNFSNHVSQVIKSTRVHARDLYRIRPLLDLNTSVLLANALVNSSLDYCNSLFLSLTNSGGDCS